MFARSLVIAVFSIALISADGPGSQLFRDLSLVEEINRELNAELPFFYNFSMIGGYFTMPSGRMPKEGYIGLGAARVHPYDVYGLSFQYFDRIELSANYRVFTGETEKNFGHDGFGDDAERIGNIKFAFNLPEDGFPRFPIFAIGADDFIGSKRFNSQYVLLTQQWKSLNLEATLGWGRKRIKGLFGGLAWTPFRKADGFFWNHLSLLAEYDATDYKHHPHEHPKGRDVKSRINAGASYVVGDLLQLSITSLRGKHLGASASLRYPLGTTQGFITKVDDPLFYQSPVDTEPLGVRRPKYDFAHELAYAFGEQGLDLYQVYLGKEQTLWIKIINNLYREETVVRRRIGRVLAALTPSEIKKIVVVTEADAIPCQSYQFRTEDLYHYRQGLIGDFELETLAPMREVISRPDFSEKLFHRHKPIWTATLRPRLLTFFGSAAGKFKYNVGIVAELQGYLFDQIYYDLQVGYSIKSSMYNVQDVDRLNPSQLPNVRTDTIRYFQSNSVSLETAFLQKGWSLGKGWYYRLAGGYFEPAYGGVSNELLFYPATSNFAIGVEEATVMKRQYRGVAFTDKIRKLKGFHPTYEHFIGQQYFLDLYYTLMPWEVDCKIMIGQFLAKDRGVRFEISRWFKSGLEVSLWYTITNGHDKVNGHTYFDKGFSFLVPIDFFLKRSSRNYMGYAMSAWLRDIGAIADNGKGLYNTLRLERKK